MAEPIDANCSINWHYKDGYIRVQVDVPGLKTKLVGINNRKVDMKSADLQVSFDDNCAFVKATLKQGTLAGTVYQKKLDKDDLRDSLVSPEPASYYKVADGEVRLYIRKR